MASEVGSESRGKEIVLLNGWDLRKPTHAHFYISVKEKIKNTVITQTGGREWEVHVDDKRR